VQGIIIILVLLGLLGGLILLALRYDKKLHQTQPSLLSFKWGYWNAIGVLVTGIILPFGFIGMMIEEGVSFSVIFTEPMLIGLLVFSLFLIPIGIGMFKRQKLGWVSFLVMSSASIIFTIIFFDDPDMEFKVSDIVRESIYLIINLVYIDKRWKELDDWSWKKTKEIA